jgi:type 2 lantibiotic biosynthesis protein LanM
MRLGRERVEMPVGMSRPSLGGAEVDVLEHADAIALGFGATYGLLERERAALLATDGPLARFAADEVRVILRPTQTYGVLLRESYHPDMLHNELDRAQLFDRLWGSVEQQRHLARVIPAELEDLAEGDVPMFTTRPGSVDLWTSSGVGLPGFFDEPSLAHVRRRIERLGEEDRERQLWFVRASLATVSKRTHAIRGADPAQAVGMVDRDELLAAARLVGDELERRAVREGAEAAWIGLTQFGDRHWQLTPLGSDLYDGVSGVAMFLGYLAVATGEERYAVLARAGLRAVRLELERFPEAVTSIGGFGGLGGTIHTLAHLSALWHDGELLEEARAAVDRLPVLVERDEQLDVIGGAAGCIGILLSLQRHASSPSVLAVARQCGDRLLATAKPAEQGSGWLTMVAKERPYSGFSHGAAGIAWALLRLADATGEERFRCAGLQGIAYERTLFSPEQGNWWDLRYGTDVTSRVCSAAWCHGAPGIGLSRLDLLGCLDDDVVRSEIGAAIEATVRFGFGDNHSLCHGDLGNLELLASAARSLGDPALRTMVASAARAILDDVRVTGWRCGNPMRVESPGLMTGLAGIGYGLLRLADPELIPSILLLEPPRTKTRST